MSNLHDSAQRYGAVTRWLHWGMAVVLGWQFVTVLAHVLLEDSALDKFAWGTHKATGLLLMVLVVIRLLWAFYNRNRRPAAVSIPARLGHLALYALLFVIPFVALLRQYGSIIEAWAVEQGGWDGFGSVLQEALQDVRAPRAAVASVE